MGKRGPAPLPTAIKALRGNPGKRPLNAREPKPRAGKAPAAPRWLRDEARREWRRLARVLHPAGLLTEADVDALAMLCSTLVTWKEAEAVVARKGMVVMTAQGNAIQSPYLSIANRAKGDALRLAREFGMTPSSRTGIQVAGGEEESLADILFGEVG